MDMNNSVVIAGGREVEEGLGGKVMMGKNK